MYSSGNIIRAIKSRMRWVQYVAHMGEMRNEKCKLLVGQPEGKRDHLEHLYIHKSRMYFKETR
jgi:hypothetical protein